MMKNKPGYFGEYGGCFAPETLIEPLAALEKAYGHYKDDPSFQARLQDYLSHYVGRPTSLYFAERLTNHLGGARIYLKREDLTHTGAHKINNTMGQGLLAQCMGKKRLIAETGAGQHGVATATVASLLGLSCVVYMGAVDMERQHLNVIRMRILGAEVRPVSSGSQTLKDATSEAMRDWVSHVDESYYVLGSALGPHPYPTIVRDFQRVIGVEAKSQIINAIGRLPDELVACVGGGSNSIGLFYPFLDDKSVKMTGVEAGGTGLDYPSVGPEHAFLHDSGRVQYTHASDQEAIDAAFSLAKLEGIIPALESAHALAYVMRTAHKLPESYVMLVGLSGRGDKDVTTLSQYLEGAHDE